MLHNVENSSHRNQTRKTNKNNSDWKRKSKTATVWRWYDTQIPNSNTKKLVEVINEFNKVAQYKTNIQKSIVYPYNNNKWSEREIRKTISINLVQQTIKITITAKI